MHSMWNPFNLSMLAVYSILVGSFLANQLKSNSCSVPFSKSLLVSLVLTGATLLLHNLIIAILMATILLWLQLFFPLSKRKPIQEKIFSYSQSQLVLKIGQSFLALFCMILVFKDSGASDLSSIFREANLTHPLSPLSLSFIAIYVLTMISVFPLHTLLLTKHKNREDAALIEILNPLIYYIPILIPHQHGIVDLPAYFELITACGFFSSLYFLIASFQERYFHRYLFYICSALGTFLVSSTFYLESDLLPGSFYFYVSLVLGTTGIHCCWIFIKNRYGWSSYTPYMGLMRLHKGLGFALLFFILFISNMPLTLAFISEDIILYELFSYHFSLGLMAILIFFLAGISLFKFYCLSFCGTMNENFEKISLLFVEKVTLCLLITLGFMLPILSLI